MTRPDLTRPDVIRDLSGEFRPKSNRPEYKYFYIAHIAYAIVKKVENLNTKLI